MAPFVRGSTTADPRKRRRSGGNRFRILASSPALVSPIRGRIDQIAERFDNPSLPPHLLELHPQGMSPESNGIASRVESPSWTSGLVSRIRRSIWLAAAAAAPRSCFRPGVAGGFYSDPVSVACSCLLCCSHRIHIGSSPQTENPGRLGCCWICPPAKRGFGRPAAQSCGASQPSGRPSRLASTMIAARPTSRMCRCFADANPSMTPTRACPAPRRFSCSSTHRKAIPRYVHAPC